MQSSIEGIFLESCNVACCLRADVSYFLCCTRATTLAELHKIQQKSIQVVAERIGLENYLIRNDVAALRNFQCNVCLRKIKTLCRHALFEFLSGRIGSSGAHKRTLVAGKEELNFEDLQEGNNLLLK